MQTNGINNSPAFGMKINVAKGVPAEVSEMLQAAKTSLPDTFTLSVAPNTWNELGKTKIGEGFIVAIQKASGLFGSKKTVGASVAKDVSEIESAVSKAVVDATTPLKGTSKI